MKKFTTLLLAILLVLPAMAVDLKGGEVLYLTPSSNWKADGARFAAYFFGVGNSWASMTAVAGETDLYEVEVPTGNFTNVIFCRMNPGAQENNWDNKWNQTADLVYDGANNHYTVKEGTWDSGGGTWSYYGTSVEVMVTLTYAPGGRIFEGDVITFSPNVVNSEEPATIYVDDKEINGVEWTATAGEHTAYAEAAGVKSNVVNIVVEAITTQFNVYLKKSSTEWSSVYVYYWTNSGNNAWPGKEMDVTTVDGVEYYVYTIHNEENVSVIFNNGSEPIEQTVDITGVTGDAYYELGEKNGEGKYELAIPAIDDITYGVYCLDLGEIDWKAADAWFSAYFYNSSDVETFTWVRGVVDENRVYFGLEDQENTYTHVVFARFNPAATEESWDDTADDGDDQDLWNKTNNIAYKKPVSGTAVYKLTDWNTVILTDEIVVPTGLDRVELADGIGYAYGVVSAEGAIEVYNVNGAVVARGNDNVDLRGLGRSVYIIRNGNQVRKVVR